MAKKRPGATLSPSFAGYCFGWPRVKSVSYGAPDRGTVATHRKPGLRLLAAC